MIISLDQLFHHNRARQDSNFTSLPLAFAFLPSEMLNSPLNLRRPPLCFRSVQLMSRGCDAGFPRAKGLSPRFSYNICDGYGFDMVIVPPR